jgi:hypothetical protein
VILDMSSKKLVPEIAVLKVSTSIPGTGM